MQCRYEGIRFVDDDVEFSHKTTWNVCVEKFSTVYFCSSTMLSIAGGTKRRGMFFEDIFEGIFKMEFFRAFFRELKGNDFTTKITMKFKIWKLWKNLENFTKILNFI